MVTIKMCILGMLVLTELAVCMKTHCKLEVCSSLMRQYAECVQNTTLESVELAAKISKSNCTEGVSYGYYNKTLWVDKGCRANFTVCFVDPSDTDEDNSNDETDKDDTLDEPESNASMAGYISIPVVVAVLIAVVIAVILINRKRCTRRSKNGQYKGRPVPIAVVNKAYEIPDGTISSKPPERGNTDKEETEYNYIPLDNVNKSPYSYAYCNPAIDTKDATEDLGDYNHLSPKESPHLNSNYSKLPISKKSDKAPITDKTYSHISCAGNDKPKTDKVYSHLEVKAIDSRGEMKAKTPEDIDRTYNRIDQMKSTNKVMENDAYQKDVDIECEYDHAEAGGRDLTLETYNHVSLDHRMGRTNANITNVRQPDGLHYEQAAAVDKRQYDCMKEEYNDTPASFVQTSDKNEITGEPSHDYFLLEKAATSYSK